jgi:hypothetical protein
LACFSLTKCDGDPSQDRTQGSLDQAGNASDVVVASRLFLRRSRRKKKNRRYP